MNDLQDIIDFKLHRECTNT